MARGLHHRGPHAGGSLSLHKGTGLVLHVLYFKLCSVHVVVPMLLHAAVDKRSHWFLVQTACRQLTVCGYIVGTRGHH